MGILTTCRVSKQRGPATEVWCGVPYRPFYLLKEHERNCDKKLVSNAVIGATNIMTSATLHSTIRQLF